LCKRYPSAFEEACFVGWMHGREASEIMPHPKPLASSSWLGVIHLLSIDLLELGPDQEYFGFHEKGYSTARQEDYGVSEERKDSVQRYSAFCIDNLFE
jgi:hypothetical protein